MKDVRFSRNGIEFEPTKQELKIVLDDYAKQLGEKDKRIASLETQVKTFCEKWEWLDLEDADKTLTGSEQKIWEIMQKNQDLKNQLAEKGKRSRNAIDDLKNKLNKTREELEIANNQILFDNTEFEKLNKQLAEKEIRIAELEDKDWYEETIKQLEEQNERLITERDSANDQNKRVLEKLGLLVRSNQDLEKQLAETEKKFQKWTSGYFASPTNQPVLTTSQHLTQDKIHFAIEQLEKVKEFFLEEHRDEEMDTDYIITKDAGQIADYLLDQIKQLKEILKNE